MRARATILGALSSIAVLAVGWQLGADGQQSETTTSDTAAGSAPTSTVTPSADAGSSTATPAPTPSASESETTTSAVSGTFTGTSVHTRFGDVQVQITVQDGILSDVTALQLTDQDSRSVSISNRAAPILRQEVLSAQSANVHSVSGATYTSNAYLTSLQSALDQAGL